MNKYLFLLDELPPTTSANGICAERVMQELSKDEEVHYLSWDENERNDSLIRHSIPRKPWTVFSERMEKKKTVGSKLFYYLARVCYFVKRLTLLYKWPVDSNKTSRRYYENAVEIINQNDITHVVAVCFPGESIDALSRLKKRFGSKIQTILYALDVTIEGKLNSSSAFKWLSAIGAKRFFIKCGRASDKILILENANDVFRRRLPLDVYSKCHTCGIPLVRQADEGITNCVKPDDDIHVVYGGNLFPGLRNPTALFDLLEKTDIGDGRNIIIDLYGKTHEDIRKSWEGRFSNIKIVEHGWVDEATLNEALATASVLLNVGNSERFLIPSKLFKYMGTGKPILHIYTNPDDPCIPYLKKYNNMLLVDATKTCYDKNAIVDFLLNSKCVAQDVEKLFPTCTPDYTAKLIKEG